MATTTSCGGVGGNASHTIIGNQLKTQQDSSSVCNGKRGHIRSASLENANLIAAKNTLGLPMLPAGHTGTLKSRNEQKRMRNKFGSHSNLEEAQQGRSRFYNIRQMFEFTKTSPNINSTTITTAADVEEENRHDQATNLLRPIAFKPIPFEPDYSIPSRYCDVVVNSANAVHSVADRYGSTPSLAPMQGSNLRFGSTTDLRHGGISIGGGGVGGLIGGGSGGCGAGGGYSSNSYCNSLMARRRGSRSLKINDSMESIRHTPDSDANNQSGTIKSNASSNSISNNIMAGNNGIMSNNGLNKYSTSDQCDMTPSPSDSGISELEAALKDRDSELSYLRQAMEHNEKDKETYWENENRRLRIYFEAQQREFMLKIKKMEQMLAMQQFQFKQNKLRHSEQINKLREQIAELKNDCEILRRVVATVETNNISLKNSERNLKDRSAYVEEQLEESHNLISSLKTQLEESEWKVCEKNGELALLKTQLKEANNEITVKEHALVHLKHETINNTETQVYQSLQESQQVEQQLQNQKDAEVELKQLNKIIILKDQVILALTNELAKLRKELSDLAIFHEYGEEPSGKYIRLKQQLDNLTDICNKTRKHTQQRIENSRLELKDNGEKVLDDNNLEVIMNCLKIAPALDEGDCDECERYKLSSDKRLAKVSSDIQSFIHGSINLPDIAVNVKSLNKLPTKLEESTLDTLIEESTNYAEEIANLRKQLDDVRVNFELEKRQWSAEKEKVLKYQKQLQTHYISMYQKLRSLEKSSEVA
uniref:Uncharacterized protein n=1 Tax=Glossina brevipalpis TaxID=37001 RepID=A0A1A9W8N2_9MUSC